MSGYPRQETILMVHQHPGQGGGQSQKVRFFWVSKLLGAPFWPGPLCTTQTVTCLGWCYISPTLLWKQLRDSPGTHRVEREFMQGGSLPSFCYCSDSCRHPSPNFGGSAHRNQPRDLSATFRDCCPTLPLSGPGNPESVAPRWAAHDPSWLHRRHAGVHTPSFWKNLLHCSVRWFGTFCSLMWFGTFTHFQIFPQWRAVSTCCLCNIPSTPQGLVCAIL